MKVKKVNAVSICLRVCAILLACGLPGLLFAQPDYFFEAYDSGIYGIHDRHFRGVLFPEVYKSLTSVKVAYPGLWEADSAHAGVGILPDQISNSKGVGWNAVYAQTEINLNPGSAGFWLGNAHVGESFKIYEYEGIKGAWDLSEFSLRGALWIRPRQKSRFLGISAAFDVDKFYFSNGGGFEGFYDDKSYYLNINTLFKLTEHYRLKAAFRTRNKYAVNPGDAREDDNRHFTDAVSVGVLDCEMRTLEFMFRNTFAVNNAEKKSDTVSFTLSYTRGGALSYMKHKLFLGLKADAGLAYPSLISQSAGSFQYDRYLRQMTDDGRVAGAGISAPIVADIDLYRGLRGMLSVCPKISYTHTAPLRQPKNGLYLNPQHRFATELSEVEISLRGFVGDRMDFAVMPSVKNDAFFTALEARYRF
jgi:hypothetical protein